MFSCHKVPWYPSVICCISIISLQEESTGNNKTASQYHISESKSVCDRFLLSSMGCASWEQITWGSRYWKWMLSYWIQHGQPCRGENGGIREYIHFMHRSSEMLKNSQEHAGLCQERPLCEILLQQEASWQEHWMQWQRSETLSCFWQLSPNGTSECLGLTAAGKCTLFFRAAVLLSRSEGERLEHLLNFLWIHGQGLVCSAQRVWAWAGLCSCLSTTPAGFSSPPQPLLPCSPGEVPPAAPAHTAGQVTVSESAV